MYMACCESNTVIASSDGTPCISWVVLLSRENSAFRLFVTLSVVDATSFMRLVYMLVFILYRWSTGFSASFQYALSFLRSIIFDQFGDFFLAFPVFTMQKRPFILWLRFLRGIAARVQSNIWLASSIGMSPLESKKLVQYYGAINSEHTPHLHSLCAELKDGNENSNYYH